MTDNTDLAGSLLEKASSAGEFDAAEEVIRDCFGLLDKHKDLFGPEKYMSRRTELQELLAQAVNTRQSRLTKPAQMPIKTDAAAAANPPAAQAGFGPDEWQVKPQKAAPQSGPAEKPKVIVVDLPDDLNIPPATRPASEKPVTVIDGEEYILAPSAKSPDTK